MPSSYHKRVLVSGIGLNPQILTELLWALYYQRNWLPTEIYLITTAEGERRIRNRLLPSLSLPVSPLCRLAQQFQENTTTSTNLNTLPPLENIHILVAKTESGTPINRIETDAENEALIQLCSDFFDHILQDDHSQIYCCSKGGLHDIELNIGLAFLHRKRQQDGWLSFHIQVELSEQHFQPNLNSQPPSPKQAPPQKQDCPQEQKNPQTNISQHQTSELTNSCVRALERNPDFWFPEGPIQLPLSLGKNTALNLTLQASEIRIILTEKKYMGLRELSSTLLKNKQGVNLGQSYKLKKTSENHHPFVIDLVNHTLAYDQQSVRLNPSRLCWLIWLLLMDTFKLRFPADMDYPFYQYLQAYYKIYSVATLDFNPQGILINRPLNLHDISAAQLEEDFPYYFEELLGCVWAHCCKEVYYKRLTPVQVLQLGWEDFYENYLFQLIPADLYQQFHRPNIKTEINSISAVLKDKDNEDSLRVFEDFPNPHTFVTKVEKTTGSTLKEGDRAQYYLQAFKQFHNGRLHTSSVRLISEYLNVELKGRDAAFSHIKKEIHQVCGISHITNRILGQHGRKVKFDFSCENIQFTQNSRRALGELLNALSKHNSFDKKAIEKFQPVFFN